MVNFKIKTVNQLIFRNTSDWSICLSKGVFSKEFPLISIQNQIVKILNNKVYPSRVYLGKIALEIRLSPLFSLR
jgi:hypothetical protein